MVSVRVSAATLQIFDALKADFDRVARVFMGSATNTASLLAAEHQLAGMAAQIQTLRLAVRGDVAAAEMRERGQKPEGVEPRRARVHHIKPVVAQPRT